MQQKEIEDVELGLNSDLSREDVRFLLRDESHDLHPHENICMKFPGRIGTNYDPSDDLSVYKVLPKGHKPKV